MDSPYLYTPGFITAPDAVFAALQSKLEWQRRGSTPRSEYYVNWFGSIPYTYGRGAGVREYLPGPSIPEIDEMRSQLNAQLNTTFDVCFLNRYHNQSDQLGWHADDSPEMDDARPIAIISLGVEREIWFCPQDNKQDVSRLKLEHGSLCLMPAGMQDTHFHRIPKAGFQCEERISLTFRGYVNPNDGAGSALPPGKP